MAYKWEKGRVKKISLPKKLSKKNIKLLENAKEYNGELNFIEKLNIKILNGN